MQLIGTPTHENIDLNSLQDSGVAIVGRLAGLQGAVAQFSGALSNLCQLADLKLNRLLSGFDHWAEQAGIAHSVDAPERPAGQSERDVQRWLKAFGAEEE